MQQLKGVTLLLIAFIFALGVGLAAFFLSSGGSESLEKYLSQLQELLRAKKKDVTKLVASRAKIDQEVIYRYRLVRVSSSGGLQDLNSTDQYVEESSAAQNDLELQPDQVSYYQTYVTPNDPAVQEIAEGKSYEAIYQEAVSWVWVEDKVLHGVDEKWLSPNYFLTKSAGLSSNPVKGSIASDCESQAYTLVSALRATGMAAENVRVVTGKVDFGGSIGGHAWVEVFDASTNSWFELEPTSGNYYDSSSGTYYKSSGLPYTFFKTYRYPVVQIWTYFNDKYFWDNSRQEGNIAENWLTTETVIKQASQSEVEYEFSEDTRTIREERIRKLQEEIESITRQELEDQIERLKRRQRQQESQSNQQQESGQESPEQSREIVIEEQEGTVVIVGKVDEVEPDAITMKTRFGVFAVTFSSDMVVKGPATDDSGSIDYIKQGTTILVEGTQADASTIRAESILIISR